MVNGLTAVVVTVFFKIYSDTSSQRPVTFYRPQCPPGYCSLGDYAQGTRPEEPNYGVTLCFNDDNAREPLLRGPVRYIQVWKRDGKPEGEGIDDEDTEWSGYGSGSHGSRETSGSSGSGKNPESFNSSNKALAIWRAVPPSDEYVAIGDIITTGHDEPSRLRTCVVRKSLVTQGACGRRIWLDDSGAVSLWSTANSHDYLDLKTFVSNNNRKVPKMTFKSLIPEVLPAPLNGHLITRTLKGKDLNLIYRDYISGAYELLSIYVPQPPNGFTALGHYIEKSNENSETAHVQIVKEVGSSNLVVNPVKFRQVWNSKNVGGRREVAFWRPIPPPGYLCMGDVVTVSEPMPPSTSSIGCLHWSLVKRSHRGSRIWWNRVNPISHSQHPQKDVTIWQVGSRPGCQSPNTFVAYPGFVTPPSERLLFHCLPEVDKEV